MNILRRLADLNLFLLVAAVPLGTRLIFREGTLNGAPVEWGTASLYGTQLLALVFVVLALAAAGKERAEAARKEKVLRPALLLLVAALLSSFGAVDGAYALTVAGWIALGAAVLHAVIVLRPPRRIILSGFVVGGVFQAALALTQFATQTIVASKWFGIAAHSASDAGAFVVETASGRWLRAYGTFGHPNALGLYLVLAVAAAFFLWPAAREKWRKRFVLGAIIVCSGGLFVTFSRSAWLALGAALIVLFWMWRHDARRFAAPMIATLACFAVGGILFLGPTWTRLASVGRLEQRSGSERISSAADAVALFRLHPLFGVGAGNMPAAVQAELDADRLGWDYQPAHVVPLLVAAETGLLGLLAWLALVFLALRAMVRRGNHVEANAVEATMLRQTPLKTDRRSSTFLPLHRFASTSLCLYIFASLAFLSALLVFSLFDHFLWSVWPGQLIFWLVLAISLKRPDEAG